MKLPSGCTMSGQRTAPSTTVAVTGSPAEAASRRIASTIRPRSASSVEAKTSSISPSRWMCASVLEASITVGSDVAVPT